MATTLGIAVSLAPGLLPRTPTAQGLITGLLIAVAIGVGAGVRMALRQHRFEAGPQRYRMTILAVCAFVVAGSVLRAQHWQDRLRATMGLPDVGVVYWLECAVAAGLVAAALVWACRGMRWTARHARRTRGVTLTIVAALAVELALLPMMADSQRPAAARADTAAQPVSAMRSGSVESAVNWSAAGPEGRKFLAGPPDRALRVYIGLEAAPDLNSRAALAVHELERRGGLNGSNIVIMAPTGSGWIDEHAAAGMDRRFGGDVAMVALQYSDTPSWVSFLFDRRTAERTQAALFTALERRLAGLKHPPHLYIYGQSLGATAGSAVFADDADQRHRVCAALWAGPPAGRVHHAGATILANSSDPVVQWSPELLWHAPDLTGARADAPHPPWIPVVTFLQTSADLLSALSTPPGHGHRYGVDQGTAMGSC
ncbi:alpha/beta-hydrolase family protein [Nocardia alni]|uniref:alpha/beta-hydrolase family protein n=1 Tax=Nocardia alni TaxID=2815723 RepID=UPI0027DF66F4|nr:alpha/beta-hydrolase family protein [Nocardia alni]